MAFEFKFPDVGEGIHEGEIVRWRVAVGDTVKEDQPLVEMETAKAIVELPSPRAGKILAIHGKEGEVIKVGATLVEIDAGSSASSAGPGVVGEIPTDAGGVVLPPRRSETSATPQTQPQPQSPQPQNSDAWGTVERVAVKGVRKAIAEHMVKSAFSIPHVTHMDELDATALVAARESKKPEAEKRGIKLTFLPFIIKAVVDALQKSPGLNAAFNSTSQEIIYKKYYNIGIAVDTPEGLMVPVIKNADQKDIFQLAQEIADMAQKCRERKIDPSDLQGGTFSITNIGSVGGVFATPIIMTGQSANLAVLKIKERPVAVAGKIEVRPVLTLALAFDHRVIDGADAARFMNHIISYCSMVS